MLFHNWLHHPKGYLLCLQCIWQFIRFLRYGNLSDVYDDLNTKQMTEDEVNANGIDAYNVLSLKLFFHFGPVNLFAKMNSVVIETENDVHLRSGKLLFFQA